MTYRENYISTYNFANRDSPFEAPIAGTITGIPLSFAQQIDQKFLRRYGTSNKQYATSSGWGSWAQADSLFVIYVGMDDILNKFKERNGGQNETLAKQHVEEIERSVEKVHTSKDITSIFGLISVLAIQCRRPQFPVSQLRFPRSLTVVTKLRDSSCIL